MKWNMRMNIHHRVLLLMFSYGLLSLLILGGMAIYNMYAIRGMSVRTGMEIGNAAVEQSSSALEAQARENLEALAADKANQIRFHLDDLRRDVQIIAAEMTKISTYPEDYPPRRVEPPQRSNAGIIVPQVVYAASIADLDALRGEIAVAANIQDFLLQMNTASALVASSFVASKNGFTIIADKLSGQRFSPGADRPEPFDSRERPWYSEAVAKNQPVFTDVMQDAHDGNLCIICASPYTANGEFAGVVGTEAYLREIEQIVRDAKIGKTGFSFVVDEGGDIIFSSRTSGRLGTDANTVVDLRKDPESTLAEAVRRMVAGEKGSMPVIIDGVECYLAFAPLMERGWSFGSAIESAEMTAPVTSSSETILEETEFFTQEMDDHINRAILATVGSIFIFLLLMAYLGNRMAGGFTKPIHELADGVKEIASGNLDKKLDIRTGDEIEHLATCFNAMTEELQRYVKNLEKVTAERAHIATELAVATNIQESMLPRVFPPFPQRTEFDIYATMHAAKEVGGDFYDFYLLDENHLVVTIADVSGKGIPAALFMVVSKTILKNFALSMSHSGDLAPLVACTNDQLCKNNEAMMFVTAIVGMLDIREGRFTCVNAGHNPPLIYRAAEKQFGYIQVERNFFMGTIEGVDYRGQEIILAPGDRLFFYTDGVTEAMNKEGKLYGEKRLLSCLNGIDMERTSLRGLLEHVRASLKDHVKDAEQSDDITMLALAYEGKGGNL